MSQLAGSGTAGTIGATFDGPVTGSTLMGVTPPTRGWPAAGAEVPEKLMVSTGIICVTGIGFTAGDAGCISPDLTLDADPTGAVDEEVEGASLLAKRSMGAEFIGLDEVSRVTFSDRDV